MLQEIFNRQRFISTSASVWTKLPWVVIVVMAVREISRIGGKILYKACIYANLHGADVPYSGIYPAVSSDT